MMSDQLANSEMINIHGSSPHTVQRLINPGIQSPNRMINSPNQVINDSEDANNIATDPSTSSPTFTISTPPNSHKRRRKPAGTPDPDAEVVALSPKTLMESDRYICEICNQGFQRDQNLQMHRRRHKVPWKLLKRTMNTDQVRKRVYVCPEPSCLHHDPCHALGDLVGIKKHYRRKHSRVKQWECEKCSKAYAVQSDYKAHLKTCGTRGHCCDCGRVFSRVESFIEHQDSCVAARPKTSATAPTVSSGSEHQHNITAVSEPQYAAMAEDHHNNSEYSVKPPWYNTVLTTAPNPNYIHNSSQQQQQQQLSIAANSNGNVSFSTDLQQHHQDSHHHHRHQIQSQNQNHYNQYHQYSASAAAAVMQPDHNINPVITTANIIQSSTFSMKPAINFDDSISAASRVSDQKSEITAELQLLPTIESSQSSINEESATAAGITSSSSPCKILKTPSPPKLQLSIGLLDQASTTNNPLQEQKEIQQSGSYISRINGRTDLGEAAEPAVNQSELSHCHGSWLRQPAGNNERDRKLQLYNLELAPTTTTERTMPAEVEITDEGADKLSWRLRMNEHLNADGGRHEAASMATQMQGRNTVTGSPLPPFAEVPANFNSGNNSSTSHIIPIPATYNGQGHNDGNGQGLMGNHGHSQSLTMHSHGNGYASSSSSSSTQAYIGRSVQINNQVMINCVISCPSCQHPLMLYASPSSNPPSVVAFSLQGANTSSK